MPGRNVLIKKKAVLCFLRKKGRVEVWQAMSSPCHFGEGRLLFRYPCQAALFQYMYTWLVCIELTLVSWPVFPCGSFNLCVDTVYIFSNGKTFRNGKLNVLFT